MINENIAKGKWNEFKGRIRKAWGDISDDDLERTKGDMGSITGMIQKKYGMAQEDARKKLNDMMAGFGDKDEADKTRH